MNIPNLLTILRIILVPLYLYLFYTAGEKYLFYAGIVFIFAGVTDVLDGYIARKYNQSTEMGAALDPLADKLMTFAVLISFTSARLIPSWILKVLGIKEIIMILGGFILYLFRGKQVLPSNKFGKIATVSFYVAVLSVVFKFSNIIIRPLFLITVILNLIAFRNYLTIYMFKRNRRSSP